jgi:hypothetical protein
MNISDLKARGFWTSPRLPKAYTYCRHCAGYQWFGWWQGPRFGVRVAVCERCGLLPSDEARCAELCPVLQKASVA